MFDRIGMELDSANIELELALSRKSNKELVEALKEMCTIYATYDNSGDLYEAMVYEHSQKLILKK